MLLKSKIIILVLCSALFQACGQTTTQKNKNNGTTETPLASETHSNPNGSTIAERFHAPNGYNRIVSDSVSFTSFLRNLSLKEVGSEVNYFDGRPKANDNVYAAVVDLPIGKRDLHQCADAVMRLRADYLFKHKKYDSIHFNFTNGFTADYATWRKGKRIVVNGNKVSWKKSAQASDSAKSFWKYLEMVFSYAGTASLEKETESVSLENMKVGDVFIKGGFPGHAVIVVDMANNKSNGEKVFLMAQSYMPAQEIQLLQNPNTDLISPWYKLSDISTELITPEWTFTSTQLRRFSTN